MAETMVKNRSALKDFLASIITMTGDLSNITAPPFVLDKRSVIEIPSFWAENPSIFVSPSKSDDSVQRALLVLRSFLSGLYSQCYMGHSPEEGVKKPLNAFLGELFIGKWTDNNGTTYMLSEQVSHHPPITACRVWNDEHGVIAEGYNRQTVTFNGSVNVECVGHILKSLTKHDEHYLMPIPDFKVKGILSTPYPELSGTYYIPSTSGIHAVIHFSGKSLFNSAKKHSFEAHLFREDDGESNPLYTVEGQWDNEFTIRDTRNGKDVEVFNIENHARKETPQLLVDPIDEQDPWETRRAWKDTVAALKTGSMQAVSEAKGIIENGQRAMREDEEKRGEKWEPLFFKPVNDNKLVAQLNTKVPNEDYRKSKAQTEGIWLFSTKAWETVKKPYHGSLRPDNTTTSSSDAGARSDTSVKDEEKSIVQDSITQKDQQLRQEQEPSVETAGVHSPNEVMSGPTEQPDMAKTKAPGGIASGEPAPQAVQTQATGLQQDSGVDRMDNEEKQQIEDMLRDQYSTASQTKREARAQRRSIGIEE